MFKQELKEDYPFLTDYFESGLKSENRAIAHSILFYGQDISAQYRIAKEISRLLNCKEEKKADCNCINCNWINENQHPAVMTISKIDNKPSDDTTKAGISIAQSRMIKNQLMNTSDYHRVFILCDADIVDGVWIPSGLNMNNMNEYAINALLKTIEEPPANTTFFFLTRDKNDLIDTIISRSQSFFVPSFNTERVCFENIEPCFEEYPQLDRQKSLDLAQNLFEISKEIGVGNLFLQIQTYLVSILKVNSKNTSIRQKILKDIQIVEHAKKQTEHHVLPLLAIENMCLNITK